MKRLLIALAATVALASVRARAGCVPVDVRYDAGTHAVDAFVTLPAGVDTLSMTDLAPYRRTRLWTSPDGSARIGETTLSPARPGQRTLHLRMDVSADAPIEDGAYPPYLRFTDGTVAVYTPLFLAADTATSLCPRWQPSRGDQVIGYGRAQRAPLASDMAQPEGYVAFGHPDVLRHGALMLVSDRGTPTWIRRRIAAQVPALVDLYTRTMGPASVPMLFVFNRPTPRGARDYKGDHLPAAIALGLYGDAWKQVDRATADQLTGFLAHELFHSWDSDATLGSPEGEALLAKEGGAELARIFATAQVLGQSRQEMWNAVARSYNACLLALPHDAGIAATLAAHPQPGQMPYDCGAALMSALALAADPADPARGYFGLWRRLRQAHLRDRQPGYQWQDLMPASLAPSVRAGLMDAVTSPGAFAPRLVEAWTALGVRVQHETVLDADTRRAYLGKVMFHLMASDCGGMVSFGNNPDGIRLDQPLPRCKALRPGAKVVSIGGRSLAQGDPLAIVAQVAATCRSRGDVVIGYAAEDGKPAPSPSQVRCSSPLPSLPAPVHLAAPDA
ncbi:hypothetical protein ISP17_00695 [Dyella ginsengisoli]|uniref:Peptidase M61 catalytic domain-containing protein n=1 Tax=Dyella ginsengisoli TaxID=363848 RepID=A0ABW8JMW9_9GAMM